MIGKLTLKIIQRVHRIQNELNKSIKTKYKPTGIISIHQLEPESDRVKIHRIIKEQEQFVLSVEDGYINTDGGQSDCILTHENKLLEEVTIGFKNNKKVAGKENNLFDRYHLCGSPKFYNTTVVSLLSGGGSFVNYYHWLFDALPRLKLMEEAGYINGEIKYCIPNYNQQFKQNTLLNLGIQPDQIIDAKKESFISAPKIICSDHPHKKQSTPKWICVFLREKFIERSLQKCTLQFSPLVYISRKPGLKRRMLNEHEIIDILKPYGFTTYYLEDLSFEEQVKLFNNAKVIIGVHGAGLANLTFCKPGTKILEIFPGESTSKLYKGISKNIELDYSALSTISKGDQIQDLHSDFEIIPETIKKWLNNFTNNDGITI